MVFTVAAIAAIPIAVYIINFILGKQRQKITSNEQSSTMDEISMVFTVAAIDAMPIAVYFYKLYPRIERYE